NGFEKGNPLKRYRGDVYYEIGNLRKLFDTMKKEGWTKDFINDRIENYIASLPEKDGYVARRATGNFKKGDLRTDKIEGEKERMSRLSAAVDQFEVFQTMMRDNNLYDFNDMINWVIKVFEENSNVLSNYQEKYQYILVDEYQDTSGTQNKLVQLLINFWDKPNIFVVGDDDQSIFRFQGANIANMQEFADSYTADLVKVVLTSNYRSTQPILNISKALIDRNVERLIKKIPGLTKDLVSSNININHLTHLPVVLEYASDREEMIDLTLKIEKLLEQNIPAGKIAVIYKEHKYGNALAQFLKLNGIPFYSKRNINILENAFIKKILTILRYLVAEHDIPYGGDEMLFEIMHFDFYTIRPIDIAKLNVEVNKKKYNKEITSLRQLLFDKANAPAKDLFDAGFAEPMKKLSNVMEQLIADVSNNTLQQLFEKVIREAGILSYIMKSPDKIELMQLTTALFDFIKTENSRNKSLTLEGLIELIDVMDKEKLGLPLVQISGNENAVNLLTVHGSKGLEYQYVFFAGANAQCWEKKRKPAGGFKLPDNMFASSTADDESNEELRRLFYVALTRAEQHLYISYPLCNNDGKQIERTMFIEEIMEHYDLPVEKVIISDEVKTAFGALEFAELAPEIEKAEEDFITALVEKFSMNVTALNNYLKCPLEFYFKSLIRIPSGKSEATEFGSAIHYALEQLFRKMQASGSNTFPTAEIVYEDFKWYINRHRENFNKESFARRLEQGEDVLKNYYATYVAGWNKVVSIETFISNVVVNGVPLKGKLDKLEFDGKMVNVVDYKTGDIDKAKEKLQPPNDKHPLGGDYWRQAVFYKILVDNYPLKDWKVISTEFDFVEPDKKKVYRKAKIVINPADIETVKQQVTEVWAKIQEHDFYTGCGKKDCHWCNFIKDNKLAVALHDVAEEEEMESQS
ncbi:MAG: ATP-dependent DNA helicase, partial [Ferruginibacter sp.]